MKRYLVMIRDLRLGSDMRQRELAEWLDMSQTEYARLESGRTPMTVDQLIAIAERLVVTPAELLQDDAG